MKQYIFRLSTLLIFVVVCFGCATANPNSRLLKTMMDNPILTNSDKEYLSRISNSSPDSFMNSCLDLLFARFAYNELTTLNSKYEDTNIIDFMSSLQKIMDGNFEHLLIVTPDWPSRKIPADPMAMMRIKSMYEIVGYVTNVDLTMKKIASTLQESGIARNNNIANMFTNLSQYQTIIFNTTQGSFYSLSPIKNDLSMQFTRYYSQAKLDLEAIETQPEMKSTGTGFFVSPDYVVTCSHVLENARTITVMVDKERYSATKISDNPSLDLAILKITRYESSKYFSISNFANETTGDKIFVLGFPLSSILGSEIRVTDGIISARSGLNSDPTTFQISAPIQPGNSGGPIINERFNVIGIASHKISDRYVMQNAGVIPQNVNFGVKSDYIIPLLSEYSMPSKSTVQTLDDGMQATVFILINE